MINAQSPTNMNVQESMDARDFLIKILKKWYWFLICGFIGACGALFFIKISSPKYEVSNTILVNGGSKGESLNAIFDDKSQESKSPSLADQVGIIKSYKLNLKTIQNLNWDISVFEKGFLHNKDLYLHEPFQVEKEQGAFELEMTPISITPISDELYKLEVEEVTIDGETLSINISKELRFNELFKSPYFSFTLKKNASYPFTIGQQYILVFNNLSALARSYQERLEVALAEESDLIYIKLVSKQLGRDVNYLNELATVYIAFGLEEKNKIADNTLIFINNQLVGVTDSLQIASKDFTNFRSKNKIVDLGQEGKMVVENLEAIEKDEASSRMKLEYYNSLKKYLSDAKQMRDLVAPSVVGITDASLNSLVLKLSDLYSQRELLSYSVQEKNPNLVSLDNTIQYTQKILRENIDNLLSNTYGEISNLEQRKQKVNTVLSSLPKTEQDLVNIKRSFDLNNDLYTFLLRKRAEIGIARASNAPEATVLDVARFDAAVYLGPKRMQILLIGLFLGLAVPLGIIVLGNYFDNTLKSNEEVENQSDLSVIGRIFVNRFKTELPVIGHPNSAITESFRGLRANLYHLTSHSDKKVFAIHSTLTGEGKSFIAANLAVALSINNNKVLLVEGDMRKPRLHALFKFSRENGLSTFLNGKLSFAQVVQTTKVAGLSFVSAGSESIHASELLNSDLFGKFIQQAREAFDYIIIDSVPIGVFSDASSIGKYADVNLVIARMRYSKLTQVKSINKLAREGVIQNLALVLNDVSDESTKKQLKSYGYE